LRANLNPK
jgi:serine/threonine protein kinase